MKVGIVTPVMAKSEEHVKWLVEAIQSVKAQTHEDWDMWVVNDRSPLHFKDYQALMDELRDSRVHGIKLDPPGGVANARNLGVSRSEGECILPLDADDGIPEYALQRYVEEWQGKSEILYGHTQIAQKDSSRIHRARPYDFGLLMKSLMMPVGSFHFKADWARIGGWKPEMDGGLEDWEYWLAMGKAGVCGRAIDEVLYIYRRHASSRLSWLRAHQGQRYTAAYQNMRRIHSDLYNGRFPAMCCGPTAKARPNRVATKGQQAPTVSALATGNQLVQIRYVGGMKGTWGVNGKVTGIHYQVRGPGSLLTQLDGRTGVDPQDVHQVLLLERGVAFVRAQ